MKQILARLGNWRGILILGALLLLLTIAIEVFLSSKSASSQALYLTPVSLPASYPPPGFIPSPRPATTLVIPTPPTPITTTAQITSERAIAIVKQEFPSTIELQSRGQLTATAILTTWGEHNNNPKISKYHVSLPVWVVKLETPAWKQWEGPIDQKKEYTYNGYEYVVNALTGEILTFGSRKFGNDK